jgi:hypothetical protein
MGGEMLGKVNLSASVIYSYEKARELPGVNTAFQRGTPRVYLKNL